MTVSEAAARAQRLDPTTRGIAALLLSMALFVCNDTLVKLASERLPASEVMVLRGVAASVLVFVAVLWTTGARSLAGIARPLVVVRAIADALVALLFISALAMLPLAEITAILQLAPLVITLLAVLVLRERVTASNWLAIAAGFGGVLLIVRPGWDGVDTATLLALASVFGIAVRDLVTSRIGMAVPALVVTLGTTIALILVGLAFSTVHEWYWPTPFEWRLLLVAALLVASGNWLLVVAFRSGGDIAIISPFRYSVILWALMNGYLVWGDRPDAAALLGTAIVAASGLYLLHRDAVRRRGEQDAAR
jgi:drug/metabolite transporter (DMT)-like permease